ncbi:DUF6768 family protein [Erythrobacter sp.]|jgi:hypothetical protein|uniref:DUF6768 family protein n=1 Tax=Erythrobacter sp. TaxID=1042 RepID=UPI002ECC2535|nr:DUF6768 family protein [Erythrobacter sp.]
MTNHDQRIAAALDDDDRAFLDQIEADRGLFTQLGDSLGGPLGGWAKLVFGFAFALGILLLFAAYRALTASTYEAAMGWGLALVGILVLQGFIKEWLFARMNMLSILREVKRLQVQVALLSENRG